MPTKPAPHNLIRLHASLAESPSMIMTTMARTEVDWCPDCGAVRIQRESGVLVEGKKVPQAETRTTSWYKRGSKTDQVNEPRCVSTPPRL